MIDIDIAGIFFVYCVIDGHTDQISRMTGQKRHALFRMQFVDHVVQNSRVVFDLV